MSLRPRQNRSTPAQAKPPQHSGCAALTSATVRLLAYRFAGTVLTSETLGLTGRREVLDWGRVQALVGEDSKTGAAVTAKAKQLMLPQELKKLRTFLSEQA